ncbi:hypothetical protein EAG_15399 [Camponotus floridanus]|uniref:Uncharacterized protein n=1 Tax=Camponotus floridanus TaxID=104421 RepID=E2AI86_CAMFO|nr:hypothetical protein EAG_15399 [Camponotus floridanus]
MLGTTCDSHRSLLEDRNAGCAVSTKRRALKDRDNRAVKAMLVSCSMDAMPIDEGTLKRSLADQSTGRGICVHRMLASDWSSVKNGTDEHNAVE